VAKERVERGKREWKRIMGDGSWAGGQLAEEEAEEALSVSSEAGEPDPEIVQLMDWKEWETMAEPEGSEGGVTESAAQGKEVEAEGIGEAFLLSWIGGQWRWGGEKGRTERGGQGHAP